MINHSTIDQELTELRNHLIYYYEYQMYSNEADNLILLLEERHKELTNMSFIDYFRMTHADILEKNEVAHG